MTASNPLAPSLNDHKIPRGVTTTLDAYLVPESVYYPLRGSVLGMPYSHGWHSAIASLTRGYGNITPFGVTTSLGAYLVSESVYIGMLRAVGDDGLQIE